MLALAPVRSLPWYFGATAFAIWATAAFGFTLLIRRLLRARAERRRITRRRSSRPGEAGDDRSLAPGADIKRWHQR